MHAAILIIESIEIEKISLIFNSVVLELFDRLN